MIKNKNWIVSNGGGKIIRKKFTEACTAFLMNGYPKPNPKEPCLVQMYRWVSWEGNYKTGHKIVGEQENVKQ